MNTLFKEIEDYLQYCQYQKKLNQKTLKAYRIDLTQFHSNVKEAAEPLSKTCIMEYIRNLHILYKPKSTKRKIASLKVFINYLEFEEIIDHNPLDKIRLEFKEPKTLPRALSLKTIKKLLTTVHHANSTSETHSQKRLTTRDVAVLELLFATGLRVSELCGISKLDIDLRDGWVKVQGKGAKERLVFITNSEVLLALRQYRRLFQKEIDSEQCFFINRLGKKLSEQSVREMIRKYANDAKIIEHCLQLIMSYHVRRNASFFWRKSQGQRHIGKMPGTTWVCCSREVGRCGQKAGQSKTPNMEGEHCSHTKKESAHFKYTNRHNR